MESTNKKPAFDLVAHLERQRAFSLQTFGPGPRVSGLLDHLLKEMAEVEARPDDVFEWIDIVLLAFDGAWRAGYTPEQIAEALEAKQLRNETRHWPDWRTADPDKAVEHVKNSHAHTVTVGRQTASAGMVRGNHNHLEIFEGLTPEEKAMALLASRKPAKEILVWAKTLVAEAELAKTAGTAN